MAEYWIARHLDVDGRTLRVPSGPVTATEAATVAHADNTQRLADAIETVSHEALVDVIRECFAEPDCSAERIARRIQREFAGMRLADA